MRGEAWLRTSRRGLRGLALALFVLSFASCDVENEVPSDSEDGGSYAEDPWALPLSFTIDRSLEPSADTVGTLDGKERRVEVLAGADGETVELLADELIVGTVDDQKLAPLLERRGGEILWQVGGGGGDDQSAFSMVRIEPGPADPEGVAQLIEDMGGEETANQGGPQRVSSPDVLGLMAALFEESKMLDVPVSPNVVMKLATVGSGSTVEASDAGTTGVTRDACTWAHMRSGGAQDIGVCDAWRLLVQEGLDVNRVDVGVLDQGFTATPDTPPGSSFYVPGTVFMGDPFWNGPEGSTLCPEGGSCAWHGTWTSSALGAVPDNGWGAVGPGGLNARIQHIEPAALLSDDVLARLGHGPITLDQLQAALVSATPDPLPANSPAFIGIATRIPWPLSVPVANAMNPVFAGLREAGVLLFAPAGNAHDVDHAHATPPDDTTGFETALTFPCELSGVVCVGGLAKNSNSRDSASGFGSTPMPGFHPSLAEGTVDIYGPGTVIVGPDPDDTLDLDESRLRERRGTSLAAAFAAGVAVDIWAADPQLTPDAVEETLLDTMHVGSPSPEVNGWVDAFAALEHTVCPNPITRYRDADGDGFGDPDVTDEQCLVQDGYVAQAGDCDDDDDAIHPDAVERCDGVDQNCDPDDEEGLGCDDGEFCTRDDVCEGGECVGSGDPCGAREMCDEDGDQCIAGCDSDADCDDGVFCNGDETCDTDKGVCVPGARSVGDGIACTEDTCDEANDRVQHTADDSACDDGLYCNGVETCDATLDCQDGTPPALTDLVPCTTDTCDEATDRIVHTPDAAACNDGVFCNGAELCDPELDCVPGNAPCGAPICDEQADVCLPCTQDSDCDDLAFCNGDETCNVGTGLCRLGTAPSPTDGVPCTTDRCDEATDSFIHTPDDSACDDGQYCNGTEVCDAIADCMNGTPPSPADQIGCTMDSCDEATDSFVHAPDDAACADVLFCNGTETCSRTLGCQSSGDPCSSSYCNETLNQCVTCLNDGHCSDGAFCNGVEHCNVAAGTCGAGTPPAIDDGVSCTADSCNEGTDSIVHNPVNATCNDNLYCNGVEVCDPTFDCQDGPNPCPGGCTEATQACFACNMDSECNDGLYCNGVETCNLGNGMCNAGTSPATSDGVACTTDICVEATDTIIHTPSAAACSNGLFCDGAEVCDAQLGCQSGTPPTLSDGIACTTDSCNESSDVVDHVASDAGCSNGLFCDGAEVCDVALGCVAGTPPTLTDGVACTTDTCNEGTDSIDHTPDAGSCGNGVFCDGAEVCDVVLGCVAGTPPVVNDGIACTVDACVEATDTVTHTPVPSICDNGQFCDGLETCDPALGCVAGTAPPTDDGVTCTVDTCVEANDTVVHTPNAGACSNGLFCDGAEVCSPTQGCQPGVAPAIDDAVPCTTDSCNELTNTIDHQPNDGACNDSLYCNGVETCSATQGCQFGTPPNGSDGVACTTDTCVEASDSFTHTPNDGACNDGLFCDGVETCDAVQGCQAGAAPDPSDNVACTVDTCVEATDSFAHAPDDGACDDGLYCDGAETCDAVDGCQTGTAPDTSDGIPCTTDACVEASDTITHTPNDGACDDGLYCDGAETCAVGLGCVSGTAPTGSDGVACTHDDCDEATDSFTHAPDDSLCTDGLFCNGAEVCSAANGCQAGTAPTLSDGVACTTDACNETTDSVTHTPSDAACDNGMFCDGSETCDVAGGCQPGADPCPTLACDDGVDACVGCLGPSDCDDFDACTVDVCAAGGVCEHSPGTKYYADIDGDGAGGTFLGCTNPGNAVTVGGDCNDDSSSIRPGATESCNGVDDDCDGVPDDGLLTVRYYDSDGDGFGGAYYDHACGTPAQGTTATPGDCDDGVPETHPGAIEVCDYLDNDCDGVPDDGVALMATYVDSDGDGFGGQFYDRSCNVPRGTSAVAGDCNDGASGTHPGAAEACDSVDNDCDGDSDEGTALTDYYVDSDGDGYGSVFYGRLCASPGQGTSSVQGDCDDSYSASHPTAAEICDGYDNDCDGTPDDGIAYTDYYFDSDGDGYGADFYGYYCSPPGSGTSATEGDCNDGDSNSNPESRETCDGEDNDCNGIADDGLQFTTYFYDSDGDGYGGTVYGTYCDPPGGGTTDVPGDCEDGNRDVNPVASEVCDTIDNDCDGIADDGLEYVDYYQDTDGDGCGGAFWGSTCEVRPQGVVTDASDCDDADDRTGCSEQCQHACLATLYYYDSDRDGFGGRVYGGYCGELTLGYTTNPGDCNDGDDRTNPQAPEVCDFYDNDCNGTADDKLGLTTYFFDNDQDGYGKHWYGMYCSDPGGSTTTTSGDCNDGDDKVSPQGDEACNGFDDDCDGLTEEAIAYASYYYDSDADGYGGQYNGAYCSPPGGSLTAVDGDCNDGSPSMNPGETEVCDDHDNDCDGLTDDGVGHTKYYLDSDADSYGGSVYGYFCSSPGSSATTTPGDCNDGWAGAHPTAAEVCDGSDNDCDGVPDDGVAYTSYYNDGDGDGVGGTYYTSQCSAPGGSLTSSYGDCNDGAASAHPGAPEICDAIDNDCDGTAENGLTFTHYFHDGDGDDWGADYFDFRCTDPGGTTASVYGDCDDAESASHPGAAELCGDGLDNDCDGPPDEGCPPAAALLDVQ